MKFLALFRRNFLCKMLNLKHKQVIFSSDLRLGSLTFFLDFCQPANYRLCLNS